MVVQAAQQYPTDAFSPAFCSSRPRPNITKIVNVKEELLPSMFQADVDHHQKHGLIFGSALMAREQPILSNGGGMVPSYPHSDLTCINAGPKKRTRDDSSLMPLSSLQSPHLPSNMFPVDNGGMPRQTSNGLQSRLYTSAGASSSGRPAETAPSGSLVASPLAQEFVASLHHHQATELDTLVRLQTERLRLVLWETRKRHCMSLLSTLEQQEAKRLKEKEAELARANSRNAELTEKVERMAAESQMWFDAARNSEAIASSLRTALQQVLFAPPAKEGYGDSDGIRLPADDAQSCCIESAAAAPKKQVAAEEVWQEKEEFRWRRACRACGEREACVLLLPCRHLCVCTDCQPSVLTCPVCFSNKNATICVSMA